MILPATSDLTSTIFHGSITPVAVTTARTSDLDAVAVMYLSALEGSLARCVQAQTPPPIAATITPPATHFFNPLIPRTSASIPRSSSIRKLNPTPGNLAKGRFASGRISSSRPLVRDQPGGIYVPARAGYLPRRAILSVWYLRR